MGNILRGLLEKISYNFGRDMTDSDSDESFNFPSSLEAFGYAFNAEGQLRHTETDEPYLFEAEPGNKKYNQKRYEALGKLVTEHVYELMEKKYKLQRIYLPEDAEEGEPQTFFFMSENAMEKADKLMLLIHGSGAVRAGQWARRLIINDCLDSGTQLPYIEWALENGFGVIVANPNDNFVEDKKGGKIDIRGSTCPEEHVETLWKQYVQKSKAKSIGIVAHSFGGVSTLELVLENLEEFENRVLGIALTDSVHAMATKNTPDNIKEFYKKRAKNWASSHEELDTHINTKIDFCPTVSAGTDRHDYTSYSCMKSVFKFMAEKFQLSNSKGDNSNIDAASSSVDSSKNIDSNTQEMLSQGADEMSQGESQSTEDISKKPTQKSEL